MRSDVLLEIKNLGISFFSPAGEIKAVDNISLTIHRKEILGIVGESGSGKSVTAFSLLGLIPPSGKITHGSIELEGKNILQLNAKNLRRIRGKEISIVTQNPLNGFNPVYSIGNQIIEAIRCHDRTVSKRDAKKRAFELLAAVGIQDPEQFLNKFPHECSGGMCQRAMIAMAIMGNPKLIIADEPTTALDVTLQAQILNLLRDLKRRNNTSVMFITHDLNVAAELCDQIAIMYAGTIVECGTADDVFRNPHHPYTRALIESLPNIHAPRGGRLASISGVPAAAAAVGQGCCFQERCSHCMKDRKSVV